jgi:hypothetical protein
VAEQNRSGSRPRPVPPNAPSPLDGQVPSAARAMNLPPLARLIPPVSGAASLPSAAAAISSLSAAASLPSLARLLP